MTSIWDIEVSDDSEEENTTDELEQKELVRFVPVPTVDSKAFDLRSKHADGFVDEDNENDDSSELEPIFHRSLKEFYSLRSLQLLQQSMGEKICDLGAMTLPGDKKLKKVALDYNVQLGTAAGDIRNYIIVGCQPTYPYHIITFLQDCSNPFLDFDKPRRPFSARPASVVYWTLDALGHLVRPTQQPILRMVGSSPDIDELGRVDSAWDIERNALVQLICPRSELFTELIFRHGELETTVEVASLSLSRLSSCFCSYGSVDVRDAATIVTQGCSLHVFMPRVGSQFNNNLLWKKTTEHTFELSIMPWLAAQVRKRYPKQSSTPNGPLVLSGYRFLLLEESIPSISPSPHDNQRIWRSSLCAFTAIDKKRLKAFVLYFRLDPRTAEVRFLKLDLVPSVDKLVERMSELEARRHVCKRRMVYLNFKMLAPYEESIPALEKIEMEELGICLDSGAVLTDTETWQD